MKTLPIFQRSSSASPRVGLALSCGGARGLAHVGVIQILEENGIEVDEIAGASMGAYVGSLWAAGYDGKDLERFAAEITSPKDLWRRLDLVIPPVKGLFLGNGIRDGLAEAMHGATFETIPRRLSVIAANLDTFEKHIFERGDIAQAVHASCAIPGICVPVIIDGKRYVDGGVADPLPVDVLEDNGCDIIIASSVIPTVEDLRNGVAMEPLDQHSNFIRRWLRTLNRSINVFATGNVVDTLRRSLMAAQVQLTHISARRADVMINPALLKDTWHDYHHFPDYIELGRRAAEAQLPAINALLSKPITRRHRHETSFPQSPAVLARA